MREKKLTTLEDASVTPVVLGGARGGPDVATLRTDRYWVQPVVTFTVLTSFVAYASWAAFVNKNYFVGSSFHRNLISPFYSPCLTASCVPGASHTATISWWTISPALLILIFPLGFRMTCYYYRKAYYRSFWLAPPACAVSDGFGLVFNVILTIDAIVAFQQPGTPSGIGISVGTVVLVVNATLLWLYSLSCHACRHLCGGGVKQFSKAPIRHKLWKFVTPLNGKHMLFAWMSLVFVAFTDLYVRLVASGTIHDYGFHF
jgi:hypothetical protein